MSNQQELQTFSTTPGYPYPVPGALAAPPQQYIPETATTISPQYFYYPDPTMTHPQQPNPYATNQTFQPNYDARPVPIANDSNGVGLESVDHGYDPEQPTRVVYVDDAPDSYTQSDGDRDTVLSWLFFALGWFFCCTWWAGVYFTRSKDPRARVGGWMSLGAALLWLFVLIYSIRSGAYSMPPAQYLQPAAYSPML